MSLATCACLVVAMLDKSSSPDVISTSEVTAIQESTERHAGPTSALSHELVEHPGSASMPHVRLAWTQEMVTHPPTPEMVTIRHVQPHPFIILPLRCSTFVTVHDILLAVHFKCSEAITSRREQPLR